MPTLSIVCQILNEVAVLQTLEHPNIVRLHGVLEDRCSAAHSLLPRAAACMCYVLVSACVCASMCCCLLVYVLLPACVYVLLPACLCVCCCLLVYAAHSRLVYAAHSRLAV